MSERAHKRADVSLCILWMSDAAGSEPLIEMDGSVVEPSDTCTRCLVVVVAVFGVLADRKSH